MHKQLSKFLKRYEILYDYQFGFREGHSTTLAQIEIIDNILYGMDHGKHVAGIYMDLSKAFDTVDHEILFQQGKSEGFESWDRPIVRKRPIWVKIGDVLYRVTLKFDGWPWKTIGHLSFAVSSFVQHFIAIGEFKLELQSGNAPIWVKFDNF